MKIGGRVPIVRYIGLVLNASLFWAATATAEVDKIAEVKVVGNKRIDSAAILNVVSIKAGDSLELSRTDADIRAIYKLGQFRDVWVATEQGEKGQILIYTVLERPVVRDITFTGNKELTTEKLQKEALDIRPNAIFSASDLDRSVAKIKKMYSDEGYFLAEVLPVVTNKSDAELSVAFTIKEGEKVLIRAIRFDGNRSFSEGKLRGVMETKQKWFMSWLTGAGTYKEEVLKNDALLVADHYMNNGFINVKVGEPVMTLTPEKDALEVVIGITEGDQFRTGAISFRGDMLESEQLLRSKVKLEQGEIFSRAILRGDLGTLTDVYADKGYAFANVNPLTKIDPEKKTVDLTFDMEKGIQARFERISVGGNTKTRDKVIRRELRIAEGEMYSATGMKRSKQNLMNLGFFEEANLAVSRGSSEDRLNVAIDVKEKSTGTFSIGGGYSSLDGFIAQGSVQQANFLGLGLKANLSGSIGKISQTYSLGLTDPYFMDTRWTLGADIYRTERDYIDYSRRLMGGDIKAGYPIDDFTGTFFMYKYEVKDIYDVNAALQSLDRLNYTPKTTTTSSLLASITRNTTDYRFDPSSGMVNSLSAEYAGLGGNNKFARFITDNTLFYSLYKRLILSAKLTLGYVMEVGEDVPIDEKFYLGGIGSLRGYRSRTICPTHINKDYKGDNLRVYLGGDKEVFGNVELGFPLLSEAGIKGVVFFDYGNAYGDSDTMFSSLLTSYGAGIRWASPIGPLRLEYGIPINPRSGIDSKSGRFEFSIGTLF